MRILLLILTFSVILGCNRQEMLERFTTPADQAEAKRLIDLLRTDRFEELEKIMDSSLKGPNLRGTLIHMADFIPNEEPSSVRLVGAQTAYLPQGTTKNLTFEYNFSGRWLLVNAAMMDKSGVTTLVGINVYPQEKSLDERNKFTFEGKGALHHIVFGLAIFLPLLTLYALVACLRTKLSRRKWLWILFIIVGFGRFALDWNTGAWSFTPIAFQLFSVSAFAPPYEAWVVNLALPLGALFFLIRRRCLGEQQAS